MKAVRITATGDTGPNHGAVEVVAVSKSQDAPGGAISLVSERTILADEKQRLQVFLTPSEVVDLVAVLSAELVRLRHA